MIGYSHLAARLAQAITALSVLIATGCTVAPPAPASPPIIEGLQQVTAGRGYPEPCHTDSLLIDPALLPASPQDRTLPASMQMLSEAEATPPNALDVLHVCLFLLDTPPEAPPMYVPLLGLGRLHFDAERQRVIRLEERSMVSD